MNVFHNFVVCCVSWYYRQLCFSKQNHFSNMAFQTTQGLVQTISKFLKTLQSHFNPPKNWFLLCCVRIKLIAPPLLHIFVIKKIIGIIQQEKNLDILHNLRQKTVDHVLAAIFFSCRGSILTLDFYIGPCKPR